MLIFLNLYGCKTISSMNYTMSFQERAKLATEQLSKQLPVTLEMARRQAQKLKSQSKTKLKKLGS
jgi:hypothetical protein